MEDTIIQKKHSKRQSFAIFDFDWTLVKPKEGRKFPKAVDDWQYLRKSVPDILHKFAKTHQIVIVTDQSKPWKIDQINAVLSDLDIEHITTIIGVKTKKPDPSLFLKIFPKFNKEKAFYVGDAASSETWSDKDKKFAENLGINFMIPEEIFPLEKITIKKEIKPSEKKEVIIMVGYPASGKSTIAKTVFEKAGYHIVDGDSLKSGPAMIKDAEKHIAEQSVVFDSTAGTKEKRQLYIKFAEKHTLPVRVIWLNTSIDDSMTRNKQRQLEGGNKVPDVVFYVYRKNFEEPTEDEGFHLIKV